MMYTLMLKRFKQRKFHCYDFLTIQQLPRIGELIMLGGNEKENGKRYRITEILHDFRDFIHAPDGNEGQQSGVIFAVEVERKDDFNYIDPEL